MLVMPQIILIAHNIRSCHNIGSLLRTAEGLGVKTVYLTGYTPYPSLEHDNRLPYLANSVNARIHKTALGAEQLVAWQYSQSIDPVLAKLRKAGYTIVALEQHLKAISLPEFRPTPKAALIVGREVNGIEPEILDHCDSIIEIPMLGQKKSFNVAVATAMALYQLILAS